MVESKLSIRNVGYYSRPTSGQEECTKCGNADWGDILVNGICGKCLLETTNSLFNSDNFIVTFTNAAEKEIYERELEVWEHIVDFKCLEEPRMETLRKSLTKQGIYEENWAIFAFDRDIDIPIWMPGFFLVERRKTNRHTGNKFKDIAWHNCYVALDAVQRVVKNMMIKGD